MLSMLRRMAVVLVAGTCGVAMADVKLQGAGASFPNPIYQKWVTEYQQSHPEVKIDYQSIGSGGGIKGITEKTIDFAGSDAPMSKKEQEAAGAPVVHIPTVAGAVALAYNLPEIKEPLKLTGPIVADIYMGKISKWNDKAIADINAGVKLPDTVITPVWRTDGSGTNFVFTNYLTTQSEAFTNNVGAGKQVSWPVGQGGKGNEGVTAVVQGTPGALGYVELNYAIERGLPAALLKNKDGNFVQASPQSVANAGAGAVNEMKDSLAVNIWNQPGKDAYPIAAFTYIIVYKDLGYLKSQEKAQALVNFLKWATTGGQKMAAEMTYAPLAQPVQEKVSGAISSLTYEGQPIK